MRRTVARLLRAIDGSAAAIRCRCCGEAITRDDPFGVSERVCSPCRADATH
jgi:hypothetical protein